jgi:hypothetical protein
MERKRELITLNVGGTKFITSLDTLIGEPNTVFAHMFGGIFENKPNEENEYYFDRDPELFPLILNYMRGYNIYQKSKQIMHTNWRQMQNFMDCSHLFHY